MKTITVIVISYNQEDVISRCLDSILIQKTFGLKHIVVSDDCSKDKTWDILQKYADKYPDIMRIYRNEKNLGIYPNSEKALALRGEADLYHQLAGDDALCDGWFESVQRFILNSDVDFSKPIGIYSDWKHVNRFGKEEVFSQKIVETQLSLFSLYLRGRISNRSLLVNNRVLEKYNLVHSPNCLNLIESVYDVQDHINIEKAYYLPYIGSIYFSGIGVSVRLSLDKSDYLTTQAIRKFTYYLDHYVDNNSDKYYIMANIEISRFFMTNSLGCILKSLLFFHKGRLEGLTYSIKDYISFIRPMLGVLKQKMSFL